MTDETSTDRIVSEKKMHREKNASNTTRRQMVAVVATALGALVAGSKALGQTAEPAMKAIPSDPANLKRTSLRQEAEFKASPQRIYDVLLDSKQFAACSGMPAEIDPKEGGAFSMFKGMIVGRNVELIPGQRIVQAWRPTHWDPGVYSIVKFELKARDSTTTVVLDHTGFPEGSYDSLGWGWHNHYWDRLMKFLS